MIEDAVYKETYATTTAALVSIISILMKNHGVTRIDVDAEDLRWAEKLAISYDFDNGSYSIKRKEQK